MIRIYGIVYILLSHSLRLLNFFFIVTRNSYFVILEHGTNLLQGIGILKKRLLPFFPLEFYALVPYTFFDQAFPPFAFRSCLLHREIRFVKDPDVSYFDAWGYHWFPGSLSFYVEQIFLVQ